MDRGARVLVVESCLTDSLKLHNPTKKVIYNPLVQEKGNVKSKAERERERSTSFQCSTMHLYDLVILFCKSKKYFQFHFSYTSAGDKKKRMMFQASTHV